MLAVRPMEPADLFSDAFGSEPLLLPGDTIDASEQLYEPHVVRFDEIVPVLGGTDRRRYLLAHLNGLLLWLDRACGDTVRVWLRGELASTLRAEPAALDVVALDSGTMATGDAWVGRVLSIRPQRLDTATELVFDGLHVDAAEDVTAERRRSALRCRDTDGEPTLTGWWEVTL